MDMLELWRGHWKVIALGSVCLLAVSCVTLTQHGLGNNDRGLKFPHEKHIADNDCSTCHTMDAAEGHLPNHDICSVCHDINVDAPKPEECGFCHENPENKVAPRPKRLTAEIQFDHAAHGAAGVECAKCHTDMAKEKALPKGNLMNFCVECHTAKQGEKKLTDCAVCHKEIRKDARPKYHGATRIAHDTPAIWKKVHGQEARLDSTYCAYCHDEETSCEECHRTTKPDSHNLTWRRQTHGIRASFDRYSCATCHDEDSCRKCHENTEPASHRHAWGPPVDQHCYSCHFPAQKNNCTTCHEEIEHHGALPSPHLIGIYPANCIACHPGGNPYRAPHPNNSTVACKACHL